MSNDDGANLPIPNIVRNHGSDLQVYHGHSHNHSHHEFGGQHQPWHNSGHNSGWKPELATANNDRGDLEKLVEQGQHSPSPPGRKIFNLSMPTFILSCILFVVTAGLVIVGGLLGRKIANLESTIPALASNSVTPNNTSTNNTNNPTSIPAANTTQPYLSLPPLQPIVAVAGWDYIGCYYDAYGEGRILPTKASIGDSNMTNDVCANKCLAIASDGNKPRNFGTEIGDQCYCGDLAEKVRATRRAPDWMCSRQCRGRDALTENCGGNWVLSVYERQGN